MKTHGSMTSRPAFLLMGATLVLSTLGGVAVAQQDSGAPADVRGHWTIYARNPDGSSDTKTVDIKESGNELSGHFKGPNQSGGIVGTINGNRITFRTKTREIVRFWGTINGDTIRGGFGIKGKHGEFEAKLTSN